MASTIETLIKSPQSKVYRRLMIKRRLETTGLYEDDWQDISADVKKWGSIKNQIDSERLNKFVFGGMTTKLLNTTGKYNENTDEESFWNGFGFRQRTLVRVEAGFVAETATAGIWEQVEYPSSAVWDEAHFDVAEWDTETGIFSGIIWGKVPLNSSNEVVFRIKPMNQVFRDYKASNLNGFDASMTASRFMEMVRDHTDVAGSHIFRPFFDDTTGSWDISTTTAIYANLDTSATEDIRGLTVWDVMEKLAEVENFVVYVSRTGDFKFKPRDFDNSSTVFNLAGVGAPDLLHGQTIKKINSFGKEPTKYYSSVQLKFREDNTSTSFTNLSTEMRVDGGNVPWMLGEKELSIDNSWIQTVTVAETLIQSVFDNVTTFKDEINLSASFIPHLDLFDRITVRYDATDYQSEWLWDVNSWATATSDELIWDASKGNGIRLQDDEFKFLEYEINLDTLETKFRGREL